MKPQQVHSTRVHIVGLSVMLTLMALVMSWLTGKYSITSAQGGNSIALQPVVSGFANPVFVTHAGDGSNRLFVVERSGVIKIIQSGQVLATPFLDIRDRVKVFGEAGLLSVAFPPNYATSGVFYVYYNHIDPNLAPPPAGEINDGFDTVVARFRVTANPNVADPASEERILLRNQPFTNHNGGQIAFGPDGNLYIGLGDGGSAAGYTADPFNSGQRLDTWLGKMLRIKVSSTGGYTIPPTNPYVGVSGALPEIWDSGLRNPWRWSFDRTTKDLYIGDVGQGWWEEISLHPQGTPGGLNFGWRCREGFHPFNETPPCPGPLTDPILEYPHDGFPRSVTGGYVYRGTAYTALQGRYFYGDYISGELWSAADNGAGWTSQLELDTNYYIASFGEDEVGELYLLDYVGGGLYKIVSTAPPPTATATVTATTAPATMTPTPTNTPIGAPTATTTPTPTVAPPTNTPTNTPTSTPTSTPFVAPDFKLPGTQPGSLIDAIADPTACSSCHTDPIYQTWRGSMMSQAGRDPIFWAALHVAEQDAPGSGDYCLRCHTPKGWFEGRSHPTDGSALNAVDIQSGISCAFCHRMVAPQPSQTDEAVAYDAAVRAALAAAPPPDQPGSAMIILDPEDNRRGPFALDAAPPHPKATWRTDFLGQAADAVTESSMCGSCHTLDNPTLSWDAVRDQYWPNSANQPPPSVAQDALFPIERTYDEWLASSYANQGVYAPLFAGSKPDGIVRSCQDCHMPRATGDAALFGGATRDCVTNGCLPVHELVGGNTWAPQLLKDTRWRLNAQADSGALDETTVAARAMLQRAATLTATLVNAGGVKSVAVRITNETGHKLPTGYAEGRRMWLMLEAFDAAGARVYVSGDYDPATGILSEDPALTVYEVKQGITPELATVLGKQAGESFHFVLNNTTLKDNRIPPRGFTNLAFARPGMRPIGATYLDGQHWDDLNFVLPSQTTRVRATLYYQLSSKDYVDFLRTMGGPDGVTLGTMWDDLKSPPEAMAAFDVTYGVPTPTPTASRTPAPTVTPTSTRTPTPTATQTPRPGTTATATPTATPTATLTPASTRTPTPTPTGTPSGAGNTAPRAVEDHAIVKTGVTLSLDVLANDIDPDIGDVLTLVAVEPPITGIANVKGNRLVFTPKPGFEGEIRLEYRIRDRGGLEATAPVFISVGKVLQYMPQIER